MFALLLDVSQADLDNIKSATHDKQKQQKSIVKKWLDSGTASWAVLVNALKDELVRVRAIANGIAKKYPKSKYKFIQLIDLLICIICNANK